ncbi:trichothecene biosynthesis protein 14 [Trichoderma asperellum]|uniref:Trichothecene biosynthesis protein 14 n=1 Tax=Trichoderma asperellum TaxID=101201 RepID=A0A6V8R8D8_TRIAP|nr:trichothecene biosynthesis protein 14 [Trichoderma asperellum]
MYTSALRPFVWAYIMSTALSLCPPFQGSFNASILDLYPESADWDPVHCKIYFGLYYNASVAVYDPYRDEFELIDFPWITGNDDYTITGIDYDGMGSMYFAATSYTAFVATTSGNPALANFTGPNSIIRYDTNTRKILWITDLVPIQKEVFRQTGKLITGFQDMAEDNQGNTYVIGTFGSIIVKINRNGGIVRSGDKIVINDRVAPGLLTFDINEPRGYPVYVHPEGFPTNYTGGGDGLLLPSRYGGKVILWSDDFYGTRVVGSRNNWKTAEYVGLVLMDDNLSRQGGYTTGSFEVGQAIYSLTEFFQPTRSVKPKQEFLMVDMTEQIDELVKDWEGKTW